MNVEDALFGSTIKYPLEIDTKTGDLVEVSGVAALLSAIRLILDTPTGERLMREDRGTRLDKLLFESPGDVTAAASVEVREALIRQEPRIASVRVDIGRNTGTGEVQLAVTFLVKATREEARATVTIPDRSK